MVGASRQRDIKYLDANSQAVTRVKPGVAPSDPPSRPGEGIGSAEPLFQWRRPERPAAGQETHARNDGRVDRGWPVPEVHASGAGRLPGVTGTACEESVRREPWETPDASPDRRGNHASWHERRGWGVGAVHGSEEGGQCRRSEGTALPRCFLKGQGPGPSSVGGLR